MGAGKTKLVEWEKEDKLAKVKKWAKDGLTNAEISHNIGISHQTFYKWKKESDKFRQALEEGKAVVDAIVVNAMMEKIKGYTYEEEVKEVDPSTGDLVTTRVVTKKVPPDTTAMIFWLKNRMPQEFRDTQLTNAQAKKLEVETAILKESLKALKGEGKDTAMLDSLVNLFKDK